MSDAELLGNHQEGRNGDDCEQYDKGEGNEMLQVLFLSGWGCVGLLSMRRILTGVRELCKLGMECMLAGVSQGGAVIGIAPAFNRL